MKGIGYVSARSTIQRIARAAGVKKRVYSHLFRHSRATEMASHLTEAQLNHHFGWVQGSRMTATYVHMSGREVDSALLRLAGVEEREKKGESKLLNARKCPGCDHINPFTARFCEKCWRALEANQRIESHAKPEAQGRLIEMILQDREVQTLISRKLSEMLTQTKEAGGIHIRDSSALRAHMPLTNQLD